MGDPLPDDDTSSDDQQKPTDLSFKSADTKPRDDEQQKPVSSNDSEDYPADTPWQDMQPKEQAAYWRAQSRKHEKRAKALGTMTPEELRKLKGDQRELENLRKASMGEQERAVAEAKQETETRIARDWAKRLVRAELRAATTGRMKDTDLDEVLAPMDLAWFLDEDNELDTEKVKSFVGKFANAGASNGTSRFPDLGQGRREQAAKPSVASGAAAYAARKGQRPGITTPSGP